MADKNSDEPGCLGFVVLLWSIFVTGPLWLVLFYRVLTRIEANELDWYLFYTYAPAVFVGFFLGLAFQVVRALK